MAPAVPLHYSRLVICALRMVRRVEQKQACAGFDAPKVPIADMFRRCFHISDGSEHGSFVLRLRDSDCRLVDDISFGYIWHGYDSFSRHSEDSCSSAKVRGYTGCGVDSVSGRSGHGAGVRLRRATCTPTGALASCLWFILIISVRFTTIR
jgi:hypothetical protein